MARSKGLTRNLKADLYAPGFRYPGGKWTLRKWIVDFIPFEGSLFIEPFAGRGNLFWLCCQTKKYSKWRLNDIRTHKFFEAIRSVDLNQLPETILSTDEYEYRKRWEQKDPIAIVLEPLLCFSSMGFDELQSVGTKRFKGNFKTGDKPWLCYDRVEYRYRLNVSKAILNHYNPIISKEDVNSLPWLEWDESVFAYVDPPYLGARVDSYYDKDFDHLKFIELLKTTKARWLLSEYEHSLYVKAFGNPISKKSVTASMAGKRADGTKGLKRVECLWSNYQT